MGPAGFLMRFAYQCHWCVLATVTQTAGLPSPSAAPPSCAVTANSPPVKAEGGSACLQGTGMAYMVYMAQ